MASLTELQRVMVRSNDDTALHNIQATGPQQMVRRQSEHRLL